MIKTHYSCAELAALKLPGFPETKKGWYSVVDRESWAFIEVAGNGGKGGIRREYAPPPAVMKLIARQQKIQAEGAEARSIQEALAKVRAEAAAEKNEKTRLAIDSLYSELTIKGQGKMDAKFDLVIAWKNYFESHNKDGSSMGKKESFKRFADDYNAKRVKVPEGVRSKVTTISPRSIERWVGEKDKRGIAALADKRAVKGGAYERKSGIEQVPELEKFVIAVMTEKPHISNSHLTDLIDHAGKDKETGVRLWPVISYDAVCRYRKKFEKSNAQAYLAESNPDAWKSKYLSSLGKNDENVLRLNQRWEMDGTPADWELIDGRYTASVCLDVWSRRPKILFCKTPRSETNKLILRDCIIEWGMPEIVKTDNGSDYVSREMLMFLDDAGIEHQRSDPFSPWQKGHVESFIKTYLHSLLELLDNFIGHNVAERKAIESRRTFAEQLFKKNEVVKLDMKVEELQEITNAWIEGTYMTDKHSALEMSPLEKVASYMGSVKSITNERALDILLFKPAKKRPIISASGIRYDKATFIHPVLPIHAGKEAEIALHPNDLGRIVVRVEGKFLCIAECPERTGIDRKEVAAHGRQLQKQFIAEKKAEYRAARKSLPMTTQELVRDMILRRAEEAGKITILSKKREQYETEALREAERAAAALEGPKPSTRAEQLAWEAREAMAQMEAEELERKRNRKKQKVVEHPSASQNVSIVAGMTVAEKYDYWMYLDKKLKLEGDLEDTEERRWHKVFSNSTSYRMEKTRREELVKETSEDGDGE